MECCFMEDNEAIAWGAIASGCRFFAGYPITPATTIFNTMFKLLPPLGGICLQGEDGKIENHLYDSICPIGFHSYKLLLLIGKIQIIWRLF